MKFPSTKQLGKSGLRVTQLGYGSMGLRGPRTWGVRVVGDDAAESFLNDVLDMGINFIDTAPDYGVAEERIGRFISHRRSEFYLATKCGCAYVQHEDHIEVIHEWQPDVVRRNVETSLNRMKTDYLDLIQFHGGDVESLQQAGLIELLLDLKSQGIVHNVGASSSIPHLEPLIQLGVFDTFQIPFSCLAPQHDELISQAAETGAGIIIRGGIAHGGPDAEIQRPKLNTIWQRAKLSELIKPQDDGSAMSPAEFLLRFTISHPHCHTTIVGTCNERHMAENLAAVEKGPLDTLVYQEAKNRVAQVLTEV